MYTESFFISISEYHLKENIGEGANADVYIAEKDGDKKKYAAKILKVSSIFNNYQLLQFLRESTILYNLQHPSILKFEGISFQSLINHELFRPTIITEYLPNKSLKYNLTKNKHFSSTQKYITLLCISDAMRFLHKHGVIHRDLKPENILFDEDFYPRVCDFGLSRNFQQPISNSMNIEMTFCIGTPIYMAPELFESDAYSAAVDVYAFAYIAYEVVTGIDPFEAFKNLSVFNLSRKILKGDRLGFPEAVNAKMKNLISMCWSPAARDRPSFDMIFKALASDFSYFDEKIDEDKVKGYIKYLEEKRIEIEKKESESKKKSLEREQNEKTSEVKVELRDASVETTEINEEPKDASAKAGKVKVELRDVSVETSEVNEGPKDAGEAAGRVKVELRDVSVETTEICKKPRGADVKAGEVKVEPKDASVETSEVNEGDTNVEEGEVNVGDDKTATLPDKNLVNYRLHENGNFAEIVNSPDAKGEILIPSIIMFNKASYEVTSICDKAFANSSIESLSFSPHSMVNSIGKSVFEGSQIKRVCFPKSLTRLDKSWCKGAKNLTEVDIDPENRLFSIKNDFFVHNDNGKYKIIFPKQCKSLKNVILQQEKPLIMSKLCFYNSKNLSKLRVSCEEFETFSNCFQNCISFKSFKILKSKLVTLHVNTFKGCRNLKKVSFNNSPDISIEEGHFIYLKDTLEKVKFNSIGQVTIHRNSFKEFSKLEKAEFNDINEIRFGEDCFYCCQSLSVLYLTCQQSIEINNNTFIGCTSLTDIKLETKNSLLIPDNFLLDSVNLNKVILSGNDVKIGNSCFKNCTSLKTFTIVDSGQIELGKNEFVNCTSLETISIKSKGDSMVSFAKNCFSGAVRMTEFNTSGGDVIINNDCFNGCKSLVNLFITNASKITIHDGQLGELESLQRVALQTNSPKGDIDVGSNCFTKLPKLENISFIGKNISILNDCFIKPIIYENSFNVVLNATSNLTFSERCFSNSNINEVNITAQTVTVKDECFSNCSSLKIFKFDKGTNLHLGAKVFCECKNLSVFDVSVSEELNASKESFIGSSIQVFSFKGKSAKIGENSFNSLTTLQQIHISANIIELENNSFENCIGIQTIDLNGETKLTIGNFCFSGVKSVSSLELKSGLIEIGEFGFSKIIKNSNKLFNFENQPECISNIENITIDAQEEFHARPNCFSNLTKLNKVHISSPSVILDGFCFANCSSLNSFSLSNAEKVDFGEKVFESCNHITVIQFEVLNEFHAGPNCFSKMAKLSTCKISCPNVIIDNSCFRKCYELNSFNLSDTKSVTFGEQILECCNKIQVLDITAPDKFITGPNCFSNLTKLNSVQISSENVIISSFCFSKCYSLEYFSIQNSKRVILNEQAFESCAKLKKIEINAPDYFEASRCCFYKSKNLVNFYVNSAEIKIFKHCFEMCTSLSHVVCADANQIEYSDTEFNGISANEFFECKSTTNLEFKEDDDKDTDSRKKKFWFF